MAYGTENTGRKTRTVTKGITEKEGKGHKTDNGIGRVPAKDGVVMCRNKKKNPMVEVTKIMLPMDTVRVLHEFSNRSERTVSSIIDEAVTDFIFKETIEKETRNLPTGGRRRR